MKDITKNIILDLLPLYLAGEVSEDTAMLVKQYIESDPELAENAKQMAKVDSLAKIPIPFKKEAALETYGQAKKWMAIRILGLAVVVGLVFVCSLMAVLGYLAIPYR